MVVALQVISIVVCSAAMLYALFMSFTYARVKHEMAAAISLDKMAEAVNQAVILIFAVSYLLELFLKMPVSCAVTLRLIGSLVTLWSSRNLHASTARIFEQAQAKRKAR